MDPEDSSSDVSIGGSDSYITGNPAEPAPPGPPRHMLESVDAIHARLSELSHVEDSNIRKQRSLADKRRRKDDRTRQGREAQDHKIRAIYDAREKHDARLNRRRTAEDARFRAVEEQIEEEENNLRRRLKRLKRGLPLDESPHQAGRSMSTASMSPPGPSFSTVPPPPKRHQKGPPSHNDGAHPSPQGTALPPPPPNSSSAPSYSFYQGSQKPYSVPYHPPTNYSTVPPPPGPASGGPPASLSSHPSNDRSPYAPNGRPASPAPMPPTLGSTPQHEPSPASRQPSSSYDTRPPPPTVSGFASINPPTHSGFAAVNARSAATPPSAYSSVSRPIMDTHTPNAAFPDAQNEPARHDSNGNGSNSAGSTPVGGAGGKRTPSTTHPYQMSEAFANRHHHCERVDGLNRGIWTYYGPHLGTADHPTGPPVEMYLRCNHDNCRRIDWRTVHGLQCHIVKNHEQPKGTIGSLEKALDRYGVPITEVEEYEREHGEGTGGTMADPKNMKIKNKLREGARKSAPGPAPGSWGLEPTARPAGYKPSPGPEGGVGKMTVEKDMGDFVSRRSTGYVEDVNSYPNTTDSARKEHPSSEPRSRFEAVRGDWHSSTPTRPPTVNAPPTDANKQLQGDAVMQDRDSPAPPRPEPAPQMRQWTTTNSSFRAYAPPGTLPKPEARLGSNVPPSGYSAVHQITSPVLSNLSQPPSQPPMANSNRSANNVRPEEQIRIDAGSAQQSEDCPSTREIAEDVKMTGVSGEVAAPSQSDQSQKDNVEETKNTNVKGSEVAVNHDEKPASEETMNAMDVDLKKDPEALPKQAQETTEHEFKEPPTPVEGPARGTRSALQSPIVANKPLNAPGSAKRSSRRASAARRPSRDGSADGHVEHAAPSTADGSTKGTDDGEGNIDGESITVAAMKRQKDEEPKTPPRRGAGGRFMRRRNAWA